jgi:PKD repeat protein
MRKLLLLSFALFLVNQLNAQVCVPDTQYTQVGIYPDQMPDGTVGQYYSEVLQFVLPTDTMGYEFTNFKILSVSLPVGLQWECSNASNGCNYNPQISVNGCGLVFGTPLLAGSYLVDVNVIADLTIAQGIPFSFQLPLTILPFQPDNSNDGFTMIGALGCAPIAVSFENNNPGLSAYTWDFGNGNTSTAENPAPQIYMQPGEYVVSYTAFSNIDTIELYTLTTLTINSMSNYGGGFPSYDDADAYFILFENNVAVYQSPIIMDTNPPVSWSLNIILNTSSVYKIEVWEADETAGEILFFGDDYMGQTILNFSGCSGCVLSGGSGGGNISYTVTNQTILPFPAVVSSDTVLVFGYPAQPVIVYEEDENIMWVEDGGYVYQWYLNGVAVPGASNTTFTPAVSGSYTVAAFNMGGCSGVSAPVIGVVCTDYVPGIYSTPTEIILSNPLAGASYQWFLNGNAIPSAIGISTSITGVGSYSLVVTDQFGCEYPSSSISFAVGLEQQQLPTWSVYPNPADDKVSVHVNHGFEVRKLVVTDMTGRVVHTIPLSKQLYQFEIQDWPSGVYFVQIFGDNVTYTKRLVKK